MSFATGLRVSQPKLYGIQWVKLLKRLLGRDGIEPSTSGLKGSRTIVIQFFEFLALYGLRRLRNFGRKLPKTRPYSTSRRED